MIHRAFLAALVAASLVIATVHAAPGRDPQADQGQGYLETEYGVGTCDIDAPIAENAPSASDCGHVNADTYDTQASAGGDD